MRTSWCETRSYQKHILKLNCLIDRSQSNSFSTWSHIHSIWTLHPCCPFFSLFWDCLIFSSLHFIWQVYSVEQAFHTHTPVCALMFHCLPSLYIISSIHLKLNFGLLDLFFSSPKHISCLFKLRHSRSNILAVYTINSLFCLIFY